MGPGRYLASDIFAVGGYHWAVYLYPDGKNAEENSNYVSVFVALASDGIDVRALFELTLLDQSGRGRHKVHSHFDRSLKAGPYTLKYRGSMWYGTPLPFYPLPQTITRLGFPHNLPAPLIVHYVFDLMID